MKTNKKIKILAITAVLVALTALAGELRGQTDIAPSYHSYYEPVINRQAYSGVYQVEFEYGASDTTAGYLVPGIEVRVLRFRKNDEDIYGSYDSFRKLVKPVAAGLYRYGMLVVLAFFVIVWLVVALNKWQKPLHIPAQRRTAETRHLAYLVRRRQIKRNLPSFDPLARPVPGEKHKRGE